MHRWIQVRMDGGRDEWMDGWMDDGWINGQKNEGMDGGMGGCTDARIGFTHEQISIIYLPSTFKQKAP